LKDQSIYLSNYRPRARLAAVSESSGSGSPAGVRKRSGFRSRADGTGYVASIFADDMAWEIAGRSAAARKYANPRQFFDECLHGCASCVSKCAARWVKENAPGIEARLEFDFRPDNIGPSATAD
jgi:hypothetical protein